MALRIESLAEELAKPEDVRLREVVAALDGHAVIFDGLGSRVEHLLAEMDDWIARARDAERLADERLAHANQLQADIEAEMQGRLALRKRLGARENETMGAFLERLATMAGTVPVEVHECGWQWRPVTTDTAFAPPFGDDPTVPRLRLPGGRWPNGVRALRGSGDPDGRSSVQPRLAARVHGGGRAHAGGPVQSSPSRPTRTRSLCCVSRSPR
jgi:hypothetical protein